MYNKRRISYWVPIAVVIVLISLITVATQGNLNSYQGPSTSTETTAGNTQQIDLVKKKHEGIGFTYGVPKEWRYVKQTNIDMYIHAPSETYVEIGTMAYSPVFLTANSNTVMSELNNNGASLIDFGWVDNSSYLMYYQKGTIDNESSWYFIEMLTFDRKDAVRIKVGMKTKYMDRMMDPVLAIMKSFEWQKANPYPSDVSLFYDSNAKLEFAYPTGWNTGVSNNAYLVQDPASHMIMSIITNASTVTYERMSQLDYLRWASSGRSNFALQIFQIDKNNLYAVASYNSNNSNMILVQRMFATGTREYIISFEVPHSAYQSNKDIISALIDLIKIY